MAQPLGAPLEPAVGRISRVRTAGPVTHHSQSCPGELDKDPVDRWPCPDGECIISVENLNAGAIVADDSCAGTPFPKP
jgi:hypothetical protein